MEFEVNIVEGQGFSVEVYKKFNFFIPFKDMDKIDYMKEENFNEVKSLRDVNASINILNKGLQMMAA